MSKLHLRFLAPAFALALCAALPAGAQEKLSRSTLIKSLEGFDQTAAKIDPVGLEAVILDYIRNNPSDVAASRAPFPVQLASLRQFSVEIQFDLDKAIIRPQSYHTLGTIADALHHPAMWSYRFLVVGHTDARGAREYNMELSDRRAEAVRKVLIEAFNIEPQRLFAVGFGEEQLLDSKNPNSGKNRRVQLINIGLWQ